MKLIVDAETWLYKAAAGAEYEAEFAPDKWTYICDHSDAKDAFTREMDLLQGACPDHSMMMVLGGSTNFRYAVFTGYKSGRRKLRRPAGYSALQDWVAATWPTTRLENVEADDTCGIIYEVGDVIASRDKDLMTLPGVHLVDGERLMDVTRDQADFNFFCQALTGDSTDGYPGLKGCGPVGAAKILSGAVDAQDMWRRVLEAYTKKGHDYEYALRMARCARILRAGEYDYENSRALLWNPPVFNPVPEPLSA